MSNDALPPSFRVLASFVAIVLLATFLFGCDHSKTPTSASASASAIDSVGSPINISASQNGRFSKGHSWQLDVNSLGEATLKIATFPKPTKRSFKVSEKQLQTLRAMMKEERFFELADEYGERVVDGSTTTLAVNDGSRVKTVKLYFLMNWVHYDRGKLVEPSRAVRILMLIRGWFQDPEAVDLQKYGQMVLDAIKNQ